MYPSLFNDVFGPIMMGKSSSSYAGPSRIGLIAKDIVGETPVKIKLKYDPDSSYAGCAERMGSNIGFLSGLLGWPTDDERLYTAFEVAKTAGIDFDFVFEPIPDARSLKTAILELQDKNGKIYRISGDSIGGGLCEVTQINDYPVFLIGDAYVLLAYHDKDESFETKLRNRMAEMGRDDNQILKIEESYSTAEENKVLTLVHMQKAIDLQEVSAKLEGIHEIKLINPVMPVVTMKDMAPPLFTSLEEMISLAEKENVDCAEIAIRYELGRSGWTREELMSHMLKIWGVMKNAASKGLEGDIDPFSWHLHQPHAHLFRKRAERKESFSGTLISEVIATSMGGSEGGNDKFTLEVAAPSGVGIGIVPGAIWPVAKKIGADDETVARALFVAAAIGAVTYMRILPTGEVTGCSGEVGVCASMVAGTVVTLMGGTPKAVGNAASIALQNTFGVPCDPIAGGGCPMPCLTRIVLAAINGIVSADMAISGFDALVPYDQVVEALGKMYDAMPGDYKCTSKGGIAATPAGIKITEDCIAYDATH